MILGFIMQISSPIITSILANSGIVSISTIAISSFVFGTIFTSLHALPEQIYNFITGKSLLKNLFEGEKTKRAENLSLNSLELIDFSPVIEKKPLFKNKINFLIKKGSKVHLMGKNGSGKSSMVKSIMTNSDYEGNIVTNNKNGQIIDCKNVALIKEFSHIFNATLEENLTFFEKSYDEKTIKEYAEIFNLKMPLDKEITSNSISDGERQKIGLIRTFLTKPDFVFIDEGLNNISIIDRKKINNFLLKNKAAVVIVSHKRIGGGYEKIKIS
ncbi:MAG: ATP-binding cassette domain-containing protein [Mycoplasmatales bacterium]|nr:ATP-binding cassette domain-containing protein [Mycoplasmatales bacterium]